MVVVAGWYRQAAREIQELNFRIRAHDADRIRELQRISPSIAPGMIKISTHGVIPEYKGFFSPNESRYTRYPFVLEDTEKTAMKLRKDVRACVMIVCEMDVAEGRNHVVSHASSAVHTKMHGRTLSIDYRIVSDLRQINLGNGKNEFYPVEVAKLTDITDRISKLQRQFPTLPALMTKRDIADASRRILLRPDLIRIFAADIPGDSAGGNADLFMGHIAIPFGWVASPSKFKLHTDAIAAVRSYFRPGQSLLSGQ